MKLSMDVIREPGQPIRAQIDPDAIRDLAMSMDRLGQLQPIGVKPLADGTFEIVFGHRRYLAAKYLGWRTIRAEIVHQDTKTAEAAKLVENTQRENLSPVEEAYALVELQRQLGDVGVNDLAMITGKSAGWVRQRLELLEFPEELQAAIHAGLIPTTVARQIARIPDHDTMRHYLNAAIESGCTAAMAEVWVNAALLAQQGIAQAKSLEQVQQEFQQREEAGMDQKYNCFLCRQPKSWRRVNLLVVCGDCQERIITTRMKEETESEIQLPRR
ncbi:MAG: ParB/RepB/Spo0J family partition protein [Candidatus Caldarchaeum sp.]